MYLNVSVNMPRGLFAIVHRFHRGVGHTSNVSPCKHPGLTGLHCVCVDLRSTPAGQLHRSHGLSHYGQNMDQVMYENMSPPYQCSEGQCAWKSWTRYSASYPAPAISLRGYCVNGYFSNELVVTYMVVSAISIWMCV